MRRESAERAIRQWVQSKYFHATLTDDEYTVLLTSLMGSSTSMSTPSIVNDVLRRLYPQHENFTGEKNMSTGRVVPSLASRAAVQAPPQTAQELEAVMQQYINTGHFAAVAPNSAPPWAFNNGVMYVGSRANLALIKSKLKEMGAQRIRVSDLQEAVNALALAGVFERVPEVKTAPPPPEPPAPPTEKDLHNRQVRIDRAMNDRDTSPIRGAKEKAQPLIKSIDNSNIAEQIASEKAAEDNAIVREAQRLISVFSGTSHSRTYSGRAHLQSVLTTALNEGVEAKEILARVQQAADKLQDSGSIR